MEPQGGTLCPDAGRLHFAEQGVGQGSQPGVRNSTHLLDLMPENTIVYAALPNLTSTIVESHRIMQERINQNAALRQWWEQEAFRRARVHNWIR